MTAEESLGVFGGVIRSERSDAEPTVPKREVELLLGSIQDEIRRNRREHHEADRFIAAEWRRQMVFTGAMAMPDGSGWHVTREAGNDRAYLRIRIPVFLFWWGWHLKMRWRRSRREDAA